jgi:hypothetical protein
MIKRFFKYLMDRKNRNEQFKKEFVKRTGVDLNEIDVNEGGGNS